MGGPRRGYLDGDLDDTGVHSRVVVRIQGVIFTGH